MKNLLFACFALFGTLLSVEATAQTILLANSSSCNYQVEVVFNGCVGGPTYSTQHAIGPNGIITVPYFGLLESITVTDASGNTSVNSNLCFMALGSVQLGVGTFICPSGTTPYGNILQRYFNNYYVLEIAE